MREQTIAIITARGGSKRIPRKNIKPFCGKPIIEYSIQAAREAGIFDTIMVSTDDEEIAQVARKAGAEVPFFRKKETSGDFATTSDVLREVLQEYQKRGTTYETGCCLYPTAPLVTADKLREAMHMLHTEGWDSVMPVTAFSFPPLRGMELTNGRIAYKWQENADVRSQDLKTLYHDCGQFYIFQVKAFLESGKLVMKNTGGLILDESEVQDIDNEMDWKMAELKYRLMQDERSKT